MVISTIVLSYSTVVIVEKLAKMVAVVLTAFLAMPAKFVSKIMNKEDRIMKLDYTKIKPKDLTFTYDHFGYQLTYKGKRIGGAGSDGTGKKLPSNLTFYKQQAEIAKRDILQSGRCPKFMKQNIIDIDNGSLDWLEK